MVFAKFLGPENTSKFAWWVLMKDVDSAKRPDYIQDYFLAIFMCNLCFLILKKEEENTPKSTLKAILLYVVKPNLKSLFLRSLNIFKTTTMWGETKLAFWRPRMTQQLWGTGELTGGSGNSIKVNERDKNHFGTDKIGQFLVRKTKSENVLCQSKNKI